MRVSEISPFRRLGFEWGLLLCHWSAWIGVRASQKLAIPVLVGVWFAVAVFFCILDLFPNIFERVNRFKIAVLSLVLVISGATCEIFKNSFFYWADHSLLLTKEGGFVNWSLLCLFFGIANLTGRFLAGDINSILSFRLGLLRFFPFINLALILKVILYFNIWWFES